MDPRELLDTGRSILDPLLEAHGFAFEAGRAGVGSGGPFARGAYVRGDRRLEFSVRWSLGEVVYRLGDRLLAHEHFMRAVGAERDAAYPGFSDDPVDGFRHLRTDLERFAGSFLSGSATDFDHLIQQAAATAPRTGFGRLSDLAAG